MVLRIHGLELPLIDTAFGPAIAPLEGERRNLELLINEWLSGVFDGLPAAVAEGRDAWTGYYGLRRPTPEDDLAAAAAAWRAETGGALGDDVFVIESALYPGVVVLPRPTLLALVTELQRLWAAAPKPPAPWLFRSAPSRHEPAPGEDEPLYPLEREAEALDALVARERTVEHVAEEAVKRRSLLFGLEASGILTEDFFETKRAALRAWGLPILESYLEAAELLNRYLRSRERVSAFGSVGPTRALDAAVSLDYFRTPSEPPPNTTAFAWCVDGERVVLGADVVDGYEGEIVTRGPAGWVTVRWRRDVDRPALVALEGPRPRS